MNTKNVWMWVGLFISLFFLMYAFTWASGWFQIVLALVVGAYVTWFILKKTKRGGG